MIDHRKGQRGIALLVALLVVALASVLIAGLLDHGELAAARTRNQLRAIQARAYADGLEAYAAHVLNRDLQSASNIDTNSDVWAIPLPPTPVPGGEISATMTDLNGRFNLNNLDPAYDNGVWLEKFRILLTALQVDPTIAENVASWMDADPSSSSANVDDAYYLGRPVPYRAAHREFVHVSELRLVRGVDGDVYARLRPYVSALPAGTLINVNTASVPVLMTLNANVTREMAQAIWRQGHAQYEDLSRMVRQEPQIGAIQCPACYGVTSDYFLARGDITLDDLPFTFFSLIERRSGGRSGGIHVIRRSRGADE